MSHVERGETEFHQPDSNKERQRRNMDTPRFPTDIHVKEVGDSSEEPRATHEKRMAPMSDVESLIAHFVDSPNPLDLPPGIEISQERDAQLEEMISTLEDFGEEELGIDLSQRLENIKTKLYFYDPQTYHEVRENLGLEEQPGNRGFTMGTQDICMIEQATATETLALANHELMHAIPPGIISMTDDGTIDVATSSYHVDNDTLMVDEALREITNLEVRIGCWSQNSTLTDVKDGPTLYTREIIVTDELLKKVARMRNQSYREILQHMQRKMFMGENDGLDVIQEALTSEEWSAFTRWRREETADKSLDIAEQLGLPEAVNKLQNYNNGELVTWFEEFSPPFAFTAQMIANT